MDQGQLIESAEKGDIEKVLQLLENGADINVTDNRGRTAVMAATYNNQVEMVRNLIEKGADINIRDKNLNNVLLYAGAEGINEIVKLANEAGADPSLTNRFGGTALIPASERGHVEVVKELLTNSDIDVNHINDLHWTALLEAIILGDGGKKHQKIVQLLVDHGADVSIADKDGITPLKHAQNRGFREIEEILLNHRSNY
ncbi:ankyrin repeat domain-containing protein [Cytobacillus praedii]|uniref:Ankyrin repeat domain-containing protein n=1 Tax=Cytobacillus praedii TaxID=1742358 RepID=A0A4V2NU98_9BACI|nr:ankyrin repeat domain-containing protein [Cytobacillus praedii]TCJ03570.1 ankyrin repeat domain-containing protein [Cytobacillus praedii]